MFLIGAPRAMSAHPSPCRRATLPVDVSPALLVPFLSVDAPPDRVALEPWKGLLLCFLY